MNDTPQTSVSIGLGNGASLFLDTENNLYLNSKQGRTSVNVLLVNKATKKDIDFVTDCFRRLQIHLD